MFVAHNFSKETAFIATKNMNSSRDIAVDVQ